LPISEECVLLASINLPIQLGGANRWQLASLPTPVIVEDQRPCLLHLRLLQEWLLCTSSSGGLFQSEIVTHPSTLGRYSVVAAGIVKGDGTVRSPNYNDLVVKPMSTDGALLIFFPTYMAPVGGNPHYIVKVTPVRPTPPLGGTVLVLFDTFVSGGIQLLVTDGSGTKLPFATIFNWEFMIEVSEY
jgi:hypothetical protein